ncbi:hypothetical protein BPOR_0028g00340 [Botrytis porri]|uniref:Uncharacterized protein n=1 Tax=Botrytis porri TaxID=87229 RepID=A0A4Z1L3Q6_9HELO|nr:hypothetical protein BPOR_0028g00340 [Botrytis porri]
MSLPIIDSLDIENYASKFDRLIGSDAQYKAAVGGLFHGYSVYHTGVMPARWIVADQPSSIQIIQIIIQTNKNHNRVLHPKYKNELKKTFPPVVTL